MADTLMQLEDWLDDLCVRFIINLPQEDLSSVARICFQVEEAQWFYEDFIRPLDPTLPSMSLRTFCLRIFQHCPLLASFSVENHTKAFEEFLQYKTRVPVRGAIMLNQAMDSVVLVKGWKKGANWSFPRGKINKDEDDLDCAIREVYEETGLDLRAADLVPTDKKPKYIEIAMREQQLRLYVFRDVPMDTNFQPRTRKEISKIQWYNLSELPAFRKKGAQPHNDSGAGSQANKFYMVAPFLVPLKKWIVSQKKLDEKRAAIGVHTVHVHQHMPLEEVPTTEDDACAPGRPGPPDQVPAIETLDGATRELQRLLKMQPPTQGLQPHSYREDKGSALLSILQANSRRPESVTQMPQTPLDSTVLEPPQPRNPHHHTNQHSVPLNTHAQEPPPAFQLAPNHISASLSNVPQEHVGNSNSKTVPEGLPGLLQQQRSIEQVPLAHSQTLPPQVQGAMLSMSTPQARPLGPQQVLYTPHDQQDESRARMPSQAYTAERPPPVQLHAHSLALLSAFRRDAASPAPPMPHFNESQQSRGAAGSGHSTAKPSPYSGHVFPQELSNLLDNSARRVPDQKSASELAGSAVEAPADQHRSALLGMFKKAGPDAGFTQAQAASKHGSRGPEPAGQGAKSEKILLQQLQGRNLETQALSPDQPSIQPRSAPRALPQSDSRENVAPKQLPPGPARTAAEVPVQIQPTRILQRGQSLVEDLHVSSPNSSPYGRQAQPRAAHILSPPSTDAMPLPGDLNRRSNASREQKQQLLSLFGKQQSPAVGTVQEGRESSTSRVASMASVSEQPFSTRPSTSSRRGTETPISPAEQSFLLEYLQTVTTNASH